MKFNYVYIIINSINHKFYIGKHSTKNLDDGYMGSGTVIKRAIKKYGIENFTKRILCFCDTQEEALKVEEFLVTPYLISREDCYNANIGGKGGSIKGKKRSEIAKQKISESLKGNQYAKGNHFTLSDARKKQISENNRKRVISQETKNKISQSKMGQQSFLGKHHSKEAKQKMSEHMKGRIPWNKGLKYTIKDKNLNDIQNG